MTLSPRKIIEKHYGTSRAKRLTTDEEFNKDAEYMWTIKLMYMNIDKRLHEKGDGVGGRRAKFAEMVWEYCKEEALKMKKKTWG